MGIRIGQIEIRRVVESICKEFDPYWIMRADSDPQLAKVTRRKFLESVSDSGVTVCATHFPEPSIGRVTARDRAFWFEYKDQEGQTRL